MIKIYIDLHLKYLLFFSKFNETWIFWTDTWKIFQYQISWKSLKWELSFDVWTDIDEASSHFLQFCECA